MEHSISIKTINGVLSISDFKAQRVSKSDVIGVVLQTETIGMVISLDQWNEIWCSDENRKTVNKSCGEAEALQTLSGLELTRNIVKQNEEDGEDMTAAMRCWQYKKGNLQWYLPSLYELGTIIAYRDELNKVLEMLNAGKFDENGWGWSSSESSCWNAWYVGFGYGKFDNLYKSYSYVTRAVSAFEPLSKNIEPSCTESDTKVDCSKLLPVLICNREVDGESWIIDFFDHFSGLCAFNEESTTFVGFLNGKSEVRVHLVVNRVSVELTQCTVPSDKLIEDIVKYFSNTDYACVHWMENPTTINFQYYWKEETED